ncbi:helix-turn-helix domain-containing protein [Streptomyces sp. AC563]|uniref:helix-turn-helix domain-containing protein n=1 Tax=Streptomyces buecherae TaxID=2763006 RepID=UPI00164D0069|nr:helix-turn-helix domain-containing protein [Streptomyces buecherae]MBC3988025.1 helix-turn-helix domain-containing protein [Streptomyces buecherae]
MKVPALSIAEILNLPALVPLWPAVGRALGLAESTTYQLAAENRLPIPVIRLGRRRVVRTVDLHAFLGLENSSAAGGATPTAPSERVSETTSKQIGTRS